MNMLDQEEVSHLIVTACQALRGETINVASLIIYTCDMVMMFDIYFR